MSFPNFDPQSNGDGGYTPPPPPQDSGPTWDELSSGAPSDRAYQPDDFSPGFRPEQPTTDATDTEQKKKTEYLGTPVSDGTAPGIIAPDNLGTPVADQQAADTLGTPADFTQPRDAGVTAPQAPSDGSLITPEEQSQYDQTRQRHDQAKAAYDAYDPAGKQREGASLNGEWTAMNARAKELQDQSGRGTLAQADVDAYYADLTNLSQRWNEHVATGQQIDAAGQSYQQARDALSAMEGQFQQRYGAAAGDQVNLAGATPGGDSFASNANAAYQGLYENAPRTAAMPPDMTPLYQQVAQAEPFPGMDNPLVSGGNQFTTPSGQTVVRADDGSGYSTWTIPGAEDRSNVLYNDNGNWRAVSRDQAAQLQQQGATGDQFASVSNAPSIAGQAMQSTGTTPQTPGFEQRALQAAGMIGVAPFLAPTTGAGFAPGAASAITAASDVPLLAISARNILATAFTEGLPSHVSIPDLVPLVGGKDVRLPDFAQHPLGALLDDPTGIPRTALDAVHTYLTQGPAVAQSQLSADIHGAFTQDAQTYAAQQGLQEVGPLSLIAASIGNVVRAQGDLLTGDLRGAGAAIKSALPGYTYEQRFNQYVQQGMPYQDAATQAMTETQNKIAEILWQIAPWNPEWGIVRAPIFETAVGNIFSTKTQRAIEALGERTPAYSQETAQAGKAILADRGGIGALTDMYIGNAARELAQQQLAHVPFVADATASKAFTSDLAKGAAAIGDGNLAGAQQVAATLASQFPGSTADGMLAHMRSIAVGQTKILLDENAPGVLGSIRATTARPTAEMGQTGLNKLTGTQKLADASVVLTRIADALDAGIFPDTTIARIARRMNLDPLRLSIEQRASVEAMAARQIIEQRITAAWFAHAGMDLPGTENLLRQSVNGAVGTLRGLMLFAGAPELAIRKFTDEYVRGALRDVIGIRPADALLPQATARFTEKYNVLGKGQGASDFLASGTVRQAADAGLAVPSALLRDEQKPVSIASTFTGKDRYGQAVGFGGRAQGVLGAPLRAIDKWNQALISAPTQHVMLAAAYKELQRYYGEREALAVAVRDIIMERTGDAVAASDALKSLAQAHSGSDYLKVAARLDDMYKGMGATPQAADALGITRVPRASMARGANITPDVTAAINRSGGAEQGLVKEATTPVRIRGPQTYEEYAAQGGTPIPGEGANLGSAGAGTSQPFDVAAGDGGAGYRSAAQQRFSTAPEYGDMRVRNIYGEPKGAPRSPAQAAQDERMRPLRETDGPVGQALIDRESFRAQVDKLKAPMGAQDVGAWRQDWGTLGNAIHAEMEGAQKLINSATSPFERRVATQDYQTLVGLRDILRSERLTWETQNGGLDYIKRSARNLGLRGDTIPKTLDEVEKVQAVLARADRNVPRWWREGAPAQAEAPIANPPENAPKNMPTETIGTPVAATSTPLAPDTLGTLIAPPTDTTAIANAYGGAAQDVRGLAPQFARLQREVPARMLARGQSIVGNTADQTLLGHIMQNGYGVIPPILPFAPFHIHSMQFWTRQFAQQPLLAFGYAKLLDDMDTKAGAVAKLSTGLHLVDWLTRAFHYAQDVHAAGNNNPIQEALKNLAYNTVGNNAIVAPFEHARTPAVSAVQHTTNPLYERNAKGNVATDTAGRPYVDFRDQFSEFGTEGALSGAASLANDWLGTPVPRAVVTGATSPGQQIGNTERRGLSDWLGTSLKEYNAEQQLPKFARQYANENNLDAATVQRALYRPGTPGEQQLGQQIRAAYQHWQDIGAVTTPAQLLVGKQGIDTGGRAPIYAPYTTSPYAPGGPFYLNKTEWPGSNYFRLEQYHAAQAVLQDRSIPAFDPRKQAAARVIEQSGRWEYNPAAPETAQRALHAERAIGEAGYVLSHNSPYSTLYSRDAGEGGVPFNQDARQFTTAEHQLNLPGAETPQTARISDYARDYLRGQGAPDVVHGGNVSENLTTQAQGALTARETASDITSGRIFNSADRSAYLDYNAAKAAYEGASMVDPGTGQTVRVNEYLQTSGYYDLEAQAARARASGNADLAGRIQGRIDQIRAVPQVRDYLAAIGTAGKRDEIGRINLLRDDALMNPDTQNALAPLGKGYTFIDQQTGERVKANGYSLNARDQSQGNVKQDRQYWEQWTPAERQAFDRYTAALSSPEHQAYQALKDQQGAAGPFGSAAEKAWFKEHGNDLNRAENAYYDLVRGIQKDTGINPLQLASDRRGAGGGAPSASTAIPSVKRTDYAVSGGTGTGQRVSSSGRGGAGGGNGSGGGSGTGARAAVQASKDFRDYFYNTLTSRERSFIRSNDPDINRLANAQSRATADEYHNALARLTALHEKSLSGQAGGQVVRPGTATGGWEDAVRLIDRFGMKRAYEIQQQGPQAIATALGGRGNQPAAAGVGTTSGNASAQQPRTAPPPKSNAPAGFFRGTDGKLHRSKF